MGEGEEETEEGHGRGRGRGKWAVISFNGQLNAAARPQVVILQDLGDQLKGLATSSRSCWVSDASPLVA